MMGLIDDAMRSDAEFTADEDQGSEECTYTRQADSSTSTVRVLINRLDPETDVAVQNMASREFEIWSPYSSNYGLTSKPLAGDTIAVKDDFADSATVTKSLDRILETDAGGWLCRFI